MNSVVAREEVLGLMREIESEPEHVLHVAALAMQLFDALVSVHGLGSDDRLLLELAAYLHDTGWSTSPGGKGHHKESARLIREYPWKCFNAEEVEMIAQVARYHRKKLPVLDHRDFARLPSESRTRIQILAALLRLADALDRRHEQYVRQVRAEVLPDRILFHLESSQPPDREVAAAVMKGDLAQTVFERELTFEVD